MTCCKFGCPLLKSATVYEPYGETHVPRQEYYCAVDDDPETCAMQEYRDE